MALSFDDLKSKIASADKNATHEVKNTPTEERITPKGGIKVGSAEARALFSLGEGNRITIVNVAPDTNTREVATAIALGIRNRFEKRAAIATNAGPAAVVEIVRSLESKIDPDDINVRDWSRAVAVALGNPTVPSSNHGSNDSPTAIAVSTIDGVINGPESDEFLIIDGAHFVSAYVAYLFTRFRREANIVFVGNPVLIDTPEYDNPVSNANLGECVMTAWADKANVITIENESDVADDIDALFSGQPSETVTAIGVDAGDILAEATLAAKDYSKRGSTMVLTRTDLTKVTMEHLLKSEGVEAEVYNSRDISGHTADYVVALDPASEGDKRDSAFASSLIHHTKEAVFIYDRDAQDAGDITGKQKIARDALLA